MTAPAALSRRYTVVVLLAVYAIFWIQFSAVRPENFGGIDEWMILSLVRRGIAAVPHANRPLGLLFNLPAGLFPGHLLEAAWLFHGHYLVAGGLLTSLLVLRIAPSQPAWALAAGALASTWAPTDLLRLNGIYSSAYAGVAATTMLSTLLLATSAGRPIPVTLAAGLAFVATRVHEGCLPLVLVAPVLLALLGVKLPKPALVVYYGVMALAVAVVVLPLWRGRQETLYQREILGVYLNVPGLALRLLDQFRLELGPLIAPGRAAFGARGLASALIAAGAAGWLARSVEAGPTRPGWRGLLAGGLGAAAAYSAFILGTRMTANAGRTQMIAGPWIGLALASLLVLVAVLVPQRLRAAATACLAGLLVAIAAGRTLQLQEFWDRTGGAYGRQARAMRQVLEIAPDVQPGTLLVFVDNSRTWLGTFVFHYAVDLLYAGRAAGCLVNGREETFMSCSRRAGGVHQEPWPLLREAWRLAPRTYPFSDVVVFSSDPGGRVSLDASWPASLGALAPDAGYAPLARRRALESVPAERHVLDRLDAAGPR